MSSRPSPRSGKRRDETGKYCDVALRSRAHWVAQAANRKRIDLEPELPQGCHLPVDEDEGREAQILSCRRYGVPASGPSVRGALPPSALSATHACTVILPQHACPGSHQEMPDAPKSAWTEDTICTARCRDRRTHPPQKSRVARLIPAVRWRRGQKTQRDRRARACQEDAGVPQSCPERCHPRSNWLRIS